MTLYGKLTAGVFCFMFAELATAAATGLHYEVNSQRFFLEKECISAIRVDQQVFDSKKHYSLNLRLKNSENCARKLNEMIYANIGEHLRTYYNSELLIDSYIAGELNTENGFRMPLSNKALGEDILSFYKKNN